MAENTKIEWADHTFNPWRGCQKVSPACDFCYAEALDNRFGGEHWGPHAERERTSTANWNKVRQWNRKAEKLGIRYRVFCASMADVFDNHKSILPQWRADLWQLILETPHLDWLLLTKRPQNIAKMLPDDWRDGWHNVWLGMTAENQHEYERRVLHLLMVPAAVHFLSCEPLLGPITLDEKIPVNWDQALGLKGTIKWVIAGGESGPGARPMHTDWARSLRDQCQAADVAFFFKQWGEWHADALAYTDAWTGESPPKKMKVGKKAAGRLLDGREWNEFPKGWAVAA